MKPIKKEQLEFLDWEIGVFFHFGLRSFYEENANGGWDMVEMTPEKFQPTELDCEQWIRTIKEAGAKYAVLTCKHHDGFALWPTKHSEYSVKSTPWKDGKGDVVREYVDACRKYGIKVGLYYSPAQLGFREMTNEEYNDYFIDQISELLCNYGTIDYLWFDGCGSEGYEFEKERINQTIRELQPQILIFGGWDPDTRWVGNESGLVQMPNRNTVGEVDFSIQQEEKEALDTIRFLPGECDFRIRKVNWFYSDQDAHTLKSLDELIGLYYYSVGKGANMLINIAPDRKGLLPEADAARFLEFGKEVKKRFSNPLAGMDQITCEENTYSLRLDECTLLNHIVLEEDITTSNHVEQFSIYIYPYPYGQRILVYQGTSIGHKHICRIPTIYTNAVDVVIEKEDAPSQLKEFQVFYV